MNEPGFDSHTIKKLGRFYHARRRGVNRREGTRPWSLRWFRSYLVLFVKVLASLSLRRRSVVRTMLAGLAAFAITLVGVGATTAQTPLPPGQKATKPGNTKMVAQTAVGTIKAASLD